METSLVSPTGLKIEERPIESVVPYARNPRKNDAAVAKVAASLKEFGWRQPIVVDEDGVVIVGHTRLKAAQALGMKTVPVHVATGLSKAQAKAYRLADNRTSEEAGWDMDMLKLEFDDLKADGFDLNLTGFDDDESSKIFNGSSDDNTYTNKIIAPVYEPKGEKPSVADLFDHGKTEQLLAGIDAAGLPEDVAQFMRLAAERHTVFNFRQIAEFYCHADAKLQDLMERSGLVIIDFNKAIEYGFVHLTKKLGELADLEKDDDTDA